MPYRLLGSAIVLLLLAAGPLWARPPHKQSLKRHYADSLPQALFACTTCHLTKEQVDDPASFDAEYPPHNVFGDRLRELGEELDAQDRDWDIPTRLKLVAAEDADGDGVPNEVEILAGGAPGNAAKTPTADELAASADVVRRFALAAGDYRWEPFKTVSRPAVPQAGRQEWINNPIDAFIAAEHLARSLEPRPEASPAVLLRRVYLDLIGLPPTRDELHAFLNDASPDAYEKAVERLLASPHYGERWGRHWMDVWRYSDWAGWTDGKQIRDSQPHIWRWRDWIVESLNSDRGYDRMVSDMLAADELHPADPDALRATGYLARNYKMLSRETWMQDTVMHTAQAFLGLTMGCARCHDHMYDPVTQDEYYRLRAVFEPHNVRLDRVPGQSDTAVDGLPRVFDAEPAAPTYLFFRGDDRDPDKDNPLTPGVPELLGDLEFKIEPVPLPPAAYYPGSTPLVRGQMLAAAEDEVAKAREAAGKAAAALAAVQPADDPAAAQNPAVPAEAPAEPATPSEAASPDPGAMPPATQSGQEPAAAEQQADQQPPEQQPSPEQLAAALAGKHLAAAEANLAGLKARIAADDAKYASPPAENAAELARAAAKAERETAFIKAEADVLEAEQKLAQAKSAAKPDDQATAKAVEAAEKALAEARQKRDAADTARAETTESYSPLGPVHPAASTGRRSALARWIVDRRNPLTARVAVNHIWLRHFGRPLVRTVFDFGQNGQGPSHPALLDWLAAEFMEPSDPAAHPWSMKYLHRLIVTSATYRMASTPLPESLAIDPDNRWLWRMPSRRMEAEVVRDAVLYVTGQIDLAMGGADIDYELGLSVKRRSIYFRHAQEKQMEFLKMFDCAAVTECYERKESIIPQQALALANSELTLVQARLLARRLHGECQDAPAFITAAFEQVLSRAPTAEEHRTCLAFLDEQPRLLASAGERLVTAGDKPDEQKPSSDPALRARENLVHVLLNHNDFVTIR
ncbi:MAG: DUF1549 and DUF1553 domain-containing protein [Pirellulales bacterium]